MRSVPEETSKQTALDPPESMTAPRLARPPLRLFCLGLSHRCSPAVGWEELALTRESARALNGQLAAIVGLREHLLLSTCNRCEVYGITSEDGARGAVAACLESALGVAEGSILANGYAHAGREAVRHLFAVAAGLDSQIVGEPEILGQVKAAYEGAQAAHSTGAMLHHLFQKALRTGKMARTETGLGRGQVTIGSIAVELARRIFGELTKARVLLLGTGEAGGSVLAALHARGVGEIAVASRDVARAAQFAGKFESSRALLRSDALEVLADFDVVLTASDSAEHIISAERMKAAARTRRHRPMFLIDLAHPADIAPDAGSLENVFLYNLHDLSELANENLAARRAELDRAQNLVDERAAQFWGRWWMQILRYYRGG